MRRTQARQTDLPLDLDSTIKLADMPCRVCGDRNPAIIAMGRNDNGAIEALYCGIPCAKTQGWPWIKGERRDD